jgi:hypothetical protein
MTRLFALGAAVVLLAAGPLTAAPGGKEPAGTPNEALALIPPNAILVVQLNGIDRARDRLDKMLQSAVPDLAAVAAKGINDALAEALSGRNLKALKGDGRILVAISDVEKLPDDATLTLLFPVKSADDFKKEFLTDDERKSLNKDGDLETVKLEDRDQPFFLVPVSGYVAVCTDKDTAQKYAKGEIVGIASQLSKETARAFLDADVALFVNVKEVNAKYGDQIKTFKGLADLFLKQEGVQGVSKAQMEQIKGVIDAAFQVLEDGTAAVLALEFRPDGANLKGLAQFGEKTGTNEALKKYKPTALPQLGTMPAGQSVYSASMLHVGEKASALLLGSFAADDTDPAAKETIEGLVRDLGKYDRGVTVSAGKLMAAGGLEVVETKDADKIAAGRLEVLRALTKSGSFDNVPLKDKPEVKEKAEKVGPFTLHAAKLTFDFDKAVAELPDEAKEAARATIKRVRGGEEMNLWFGTDGKVVLQVTGKDWAEAKALVEAHLDKDKAVEKDEAYRFTRKQLPSEATMVALLDAAQTTHTLLGLLKDAAGALPGFPLAIPDLKAPTGKPSYVGVALVLKPGHGSFDLFIPATAAGPVRKLLEPLIDKDQ